MNTENKSISLTDIKYIQNQLEKILFEDRKDPTYAQKKE